MTISLFGSQTFGPDKTLINLFETLQQKFSQHKFVLQDPTEDLVIPKGEWWIIDKATGISELKIFKNLENFIHTKSLSVHDYDLFLELTLLNKLNKLPKIKIIALPISWEKKQILENLEKILAK